MSDLYKNTFRGYLIDHHSPAPPTVDFTNLNPEEYERFYQEAAISNLMVYTKDHWGYSYYDTKVGTRHPGLTFDYIAEISRILRKNNIEFNAYYCLEYDTLAPRQHPEWAIRDQFGQPVTLKGRMAKWGMPCYETGYRQYVLDQLAEVVSKYHPDSLFLDIFGKSLCYCDACKAKFKAKYGYDLPVTQQIPQNEYASFDFGEKGRDVNAFLEDCAQEMLSDVLRTVKGIDPDIKVTINFAALYPKKIRDMLDYQFTEPWAGNWLSAAYSRDTAKGQYPQLGPGDISEVYNYRPDAVYELAAAQIAANGCRVFFYSGSQHVDGSLEHTEAQKVGKAFGEIEKFEPYLRNRKPAADVAILQSDASSAAGGGNLVIMNAIGRCKKPDAHRAAILGAMQLCDYAKYSWKVVPEQELSLEEAAKYKVILLPGLSHVSDELGAVLREYVQNGGHIVAEGECGLYRMDGSKLPDFSLSDLLGCHFAETIDCYQDAEYGGYLQKDSSPLFRYLPDTTPPVGNIQYGVTISEGTALGKLVHPCTPLTDTTWVNWWCPPPAVSASDWPGMVENQVGTGSSLYLPFDFFTHAGTLNLHRQLFAGILETRILNPSIRLETPYPETLSMAVYRQDSGLIVHEISHLAEKTNGDAPEISGGILKVSRKDFQNLEAVRVYPTEEKLPVREAGDFWEIPLPPLSIHQILKLIP